MKKFISIFSFILISLTLSAQDFLPERPNGMVNDYGDMISAQEEGLLESKLRAYRDSTSNAIVIASFESFQGYSKEEIATTLFNNWRMWEGERYNGVLILLSKNEREIRIEVGYGLEGAIPDANANRIINEIMVPNFRNGNFYAGLDQATTAMIRMAAGEFEGIERRQVTNDVPADIIIIFIVIIFVIISIIRKGGGGRGGRRRTLGAAEILFWGAMMGGGPRRGSGGGFGGGGFSGGGGFGGFSGGGGFGSGGGGAGGSW